MTEQCRVVREGCTVMTALRSSSLLNGEGVRKHKAKSVCMAARGLCYLP